MPFRPTEDQISTGKCWGDWLESIEREFRYFRINNPVDKKDALIIYGGPEIARLEKCLPDEDPYGSLDDYQKLKTKLNSYFMPKRNKHYARYMSLKTRPEAGETTVAYATRLRQEAYECDFGDNTEERILEHLIQTIENELLIQRCLSKGWTLQQFLAEAGQIEDISLQVHDMKADQWSKQIFHIDEQRWNWTHRSSDNQEGRRTQPCSYGGLIKAHIKGRNCPAYGAQCEICKKFNHFTSVCRAKMCRTETTDEMQNRQSCSQIKKRVRVKKTEEKSSNSDMSSDDEFLAQSGAHMTVKTIKESSQDNGALYRHIEELQERVANLEKDLLASKKIVGNLVTKQEAEENGPYDRADNKIQTLQKKTDLLNDQYGNRLKTFSFDMDQPALKGVIPHIKTKVEIDSDQPDIHVSNIEIARETRTSVMEVRHDEKKTRDNQTHRRRKRNGKRP